MSNNLETANLEDRTVAWDHAQNLAFASTDASIIPNHDKSKGPVDKLESTMEVPIMESSTLKPLENDLLAGAEGELDDLFADIDFGDKESSGITTKGKVVESAMDTMTEVALDAPYASNATTLNVNEPVPDNITSEDKGQEPRRQASNDLLTVLDSIESNYETKSENKSVEGNDPSPEDEATNTATEASEPTIPAAKSAMEVDENVDKSSAKVEITAVSNKKVEAKQPIVKQKSGKEKIKDKGKADESALDNTPHKRGSLKDGGRSDSSKGDAISEHKSSVKEKDKGVKPPVRAPAKSLSTKEIKQSDGDAALTPEDMANAAEALAMMAKKKVQHATPQPPSTDPTNPRRKSRPDPAAAKSAAAKDGAAITEVKKLSSNAEKAGVIDAMTSDATSADTAAGPSSHLKEGVRRKSGYQKKAENRTASTEGAGEGVTLPDIASSKGTATSEQSKKDALLQRKKELMQQYSHKPHGPMGKAKKKAEEASAGDTDNEDKESGGGSGIRLPPIAGAVTAGNGRVVLQSYSLDDGGHSSSNRREGLDHSKLPHSSPTERGSRNRLLLADQNGDDDNSVVSSSQHNAQQQNGGSPRKRRKPLYLRMIAKAQRMLMEEEKKKNEEYMKQRQSRPKNTPSRSELKEHALKVTEFLKSKADLNRQNHIAQIRALKEQRQQQRLLRGDSADTLDNEPDDNDSVEGGIHKHKNHGHDDPQGDGDSVHTAVSRDPTHASSAVKKSGQKHQAKLQRELEKYDHIAAVLDEQKAERQRKYRSAMKKAGLVHDAETHRDDTDVDADADPSSSPRSTYVSPSKKNKISPSPKKPKKKLAMAMNVVTIDGDVLPLDEDHVPGDEQEEHHHKRQSTPFQRVPTSHMIDGMSNVDFDPEVDIKQVGEEEEMLSMLLADYTPTMNTQPLPEMMHAHTAGFLDDDLADEEDQASLARMRTILPVITSDTQSSAEVSPTNELQQHGDHQLDVQPTAETSPATVSSVLTEINVVNLSLTAENTGAEDGELNLPGLSMAAVATYIAPDWMSMLGATSLDTSLEDAGMSS